MALKLGELVAFLKTDDKQFEAGLDKAHGKLGKAGAKMAATAAALGLGTALAAGLVQTLNIDAANDKLAAQLGLSAQESKRIGEVAGDLYADAYGSSIEEVNTAVDSVISSIDGMRDATSDALQDMTADVLDLATAFELDVARAAQVAGEVVSSGLATDAGQALDLLTASLQRVPAAVREDLLDALDEYGPFMTSIGVTGEKAFGLLVASAERGMFGIDKTGDALKEFTIRATDMSAASKVGFDALGLSQEQMSAKLLAGGQTAAGAFDQIVAGLLAIQDPVKQSQAALALFGTPLEDLSVSEIPAFLASLQGATGGLGEVEGAVDRMGDTLNDNAKTTLESFKRKAQEAFTDKLAAAIPTIEKVLGFLAEHKEIVGPLAVALGVLALAIGAASVAMKIATVAQWLFNTALFASPITWIVLGILLVVGAIVLIATKTDWFQRLWNTVWGGIKAAAQAVGEWFSGPFAGFFVRLWEGIVGGVIGVKNWIVNTWNSVVGFVAGIPGRISSAASGMWDGIKDAFRGAINWIISKWNNLSFSIPSISVFGRQIGGGTFHTPNIPMLAQGGIVPATRGGRLAVLGEGREDEAVAPLSRLAAMIRDAVREAGPGVLVLDVDLGEGISRRIEVDLRRRDRRLVRRIDAGAGVSL